MKKLLSLTLALASMLGVSAAGPIMVGHRGSLYGVENSVESFTNGAKMGYEYLETDFKVTKDKQLVCSHDDDISRLGGSTLTIAGSTLAELQAVPFTQTRSGVKYTGRLCSAQEYLDVCKEYNCRPLIELKWATGINSNDCSNIPMLIDFIEKNGFRNKCIILTSMKPCLEYIRKNYPDIELQFLTGQYWASHFDWCVTYGIDADIQAGYFDKSTVQKYHDAGLKVNMWTTNTNDGYKQYGNWGCDFITTDYLDPKNLPELDASVTFPPNTVDYPNLDAEVKGSYSPEKVAEYELPAAVANMNIRHALMNNNTWYILGADNSGATSVTIVDALEGTVKGTVNTTGINAALGDIAFTADGVLLASTVAKVPFAGGGDVFNVYAWQNVSASPQKLVAIETSDKAGNWNTSLVGEVMAASGRLNDLKLYVSSRSASGTTYRIVGMPVQNKQLVEDKIVYAMGTGYTQAAWGDWHMTVTPNSRNNILVDSPVMQPAEYTFNWDETRVEMAEYAKPAAGLLDNAATGMSFHRRASKVYALVPACGANATMYTAAVHDITDGLAKAKAVSPAIHDGLGNTPHTYAATAFSHTADGTFLHILAAGQGAAAFRLIGEEIPEVVENTDFEFTRDWIQSNTTGNHPGNIDGTNAQQGTAVNGIFYINNCAEKKLHIFDEHGEIGSIPGGSGWGCARDDAGNIVVRDDKLTGNTHSFIVYEPNPKPGDYGTVTFTVDVPLSGQTNFINASGDLLAGTGHIYMFPNGQTAANIITVTNGVVTATTKSGELSQSGSTAGYIIPIKNDPENWIYMVRTVGMHMYKGGTNEVVNTDRASTTAPARNSSCGGAYFTIRGHNILVHNSGANYKGGFTVRDLTDNKVIASVDPIGTLGYETGGNYSTSNWSIPERVDDGTYRIYQYCPANGIAMYTLHDKNYSGVENIATTGNAGDNGLSAVCNDGILTVSAPAINTVQVFATSGTLAASTTAANTDRATVNIAHLPKGVYVVRVNGSAATKIVR